MRSLQWYKRGAAYEVSLKIVEIREKTVKTLRKDSLNIKKRQFKLL